MMALAFGQLGFAQECKDGVCVLRAIANKVVESPVVHAVQSVVGRVDHSFGYQVNEVDQHSIRCDAQPVSQPVRCEQHQVRHVVSSIACTVVQRPVVGVVTSRVCYPCWPVRSVCYRR